MSVYEVVNLQQRPDQWSVWLTGFHNLILSSGFATYTQTGELDIATSVAPALNAYAGFRVYYLNDAHHGSWPIYLKVWYGLAGYVDAPKVAVQWGVALDGAGTFTLPVGTSSLILGATGANSDIPDAATAYACSSFGPGYSATMFGRGTALSDSSPVLCVQREVSDTGELVLGGNFSTYVSCNSASTGWRCYSYLRRSATLIGGTTNNFAMVPWDISFAGSYMEFFPIYARYPFVAVSPAAMLYRNTDSAEDQLYSVPVLGGSLPYRTVANKCVGGVPSYTTNGIAFRWEP